MGKRILRLVAVVLTVSAITFLMVDRLPGDVAYQIAGPDASLQDVQAIRQSLGLDKNIALRYLTWLGRAFTGDLGVSYLTHEKVWDAISARLPVTIELMVLAQMISLCLAVPIGIYTAYRPGSITDKICGCMAFATMSVPVFVMALVLVLVFALTLGWLPATGYIPISQGLIDNLRSMILPAMSIALIEWVPLMRTLRSDMITTLKEDYILVARSKGLPPARILLCHALRSSLFTLITPLGPSHRSSDRRIADRRDRFCPAGNRPPDGGGHFRQGFHDRSGVHPFYRHRLCGGKRYRGRLLRSARSTNSQKERHWLKQAKTYRLAAMVNGRCPRPWGYPSGWPCCGWPWFLPWR